MDAQVEALVNITQIVIRFKRIKCNEEKASEIIEHCVEQCSKLFGYVTLGDRLAAMSELCQRLIPKSSGSNLPKEPSFDDY